MSKILLNLHKGVLSITLNNPEKRNALNHTVLQELLAALKQAENNADVRVILIKAEGKHFCAGADLVAMQAMVSVSEQDNLEDASLLAAVLASLYHCPKPTLAAVHGAVFGGGVGLVAACDMAIAANHAQFCFSEVNLGLIPAIIAPYVTRALGARASVGLFMSAETFDSEHALLLGLIQKTVDATMLSSISLALAENIAAKPALAVRLAKAWVREIDGKPIDEALIRLSAKKLASIRVSDEAQAALKTHLASKR